MDMIAVDIGNSRVNVAVFNKNKMGRVEHFAHDDGASLRDALCEMREECGAQPLGARTVPVVASSVNRSGLTLVEQMVGEALDQRILLIGRDIPLEMRVGVEEPEAVGSDRLITAWAAFEVVEQAVVVADYGSATTIDCVNDNGIFLGGVIMPGLQLAATSLHEHTDALPLVEPRVPAEDFGTSTIKAIQHGLYFGAQGALRGMVERYAELLGHWPQVVLTGGFSRLMAEGCEFADSVVPDLCLSGVYLAYKRFREQQDEGELN